MSHRHYKGETVACPTCGAAPRVRCAGSWPGRGPKTHSARRRAASEAETRAHVPLASPEPINFTCPTCPARAQEPCRLPPDEYHPERLQAALREEQLLAAIRRDLIGLSS